MSVLVLAITSLLLYHSTVLSDDLVGRIQVRLHLNKLQFVSGEWIFVDCRVRNLVSNNVQIPRLDPRDLMRFVNLVDPQGTRLSAGVIIGRFGEYPTESLLAGTEIVRTFSLGGFGNTDSFTGIVKNLKPGLYRVWVSLGDVHSDTLAIRIVEPTAEDRVFADRLNARVSNYVKMTVQTAIQEGKDLIRSYPHSPYLPNAYFSLMSALQFSDNPQWNTHDLKEIAEDYLEKFPDYGGMADGIHFYALAVQNYIGARHKRILSSSQVSAIEAELQGLRARHHGSRVVAYIDEEVSFFRSLQNH